MAVTVVEAGHVHVLAADAAVVALAVPYNAGMKPRDMEAHLLTQVAADHVAAVADAVGMRCDFELSRMRVVSTQLAPITTTLPRTWRSAPVSRSKYWTPFARPRSSTSTRATTAFERISSFPVLRAAGSRWSAEQKNDAVSQPRPHWPQ